MANSLLRSGVGTRLARSCAVAASLAVGLTAVLNYASAQTTPPPAKKPPPAAKAPPAKGGDKKGADAASNPWVKLCEKATAAAKNKEGKEEKKELNICMTHHERIDGSSGMVVVSAALQQLKVEGEPKDKLQFLIMVPTGMLLKPGMRATFFPKDLWAKVEKNEKLDKAEESKLKAVQLEYSLCHAMGCTAEAEATPELVSSLKANGGLMVFALRPSGAPVAFPVPLAGFEAALAGAPVDPQKYGEARKSLMMQIAQRQRDLAEELKKQQEDLNKMQPNVGPPAKAPAAPPAKK
jgi:invasion protein IalB